jgi:hypothetical protein
MKYVRTYESFKSDKLNEEFIGSLFSGIFKKIKDTINKTKGGKEVEEIYQKYIKIIQDQIQKDTKLTLDIENLSKGEVKKPEEKKPEEKKPEEKKEKMSYKKSEKIFEQEISADILKKQSNLIGQIIKKNKELAIKEMDTILKKYGGSASNPSLSAIIDSKKLQFEIDVLNAQAQALEAAGDTKTADELKKQSEVKSKEMQKSLEEGINKKPVSYQVGDEVIYLLKDKTIQDWEKITDEQKKDVKNKPASDIVGVGKIEKIEGDKFIIDYGDDKGLKADKTSDKIISKKEGDSKEVQDAKEALSKIKEDPNKMGIVNKLANFLQDDKNKEKWPEIEKIMGGEA